uniref:DNA 3'-5' helicase n=1 Tax=viral metagenome TaxID=1070528 RepID=A0A6H1ZIR2_9ZZZZ
MKEELLNKIEELKKLFTPYKRPTLDTGQLEAVWEKSKTTLVLAGAGTGKTAVITEKIQNLLAKGVDPEKILAITYTKKAAAEMERRVQNKNIQISTIHAFCYKLLKECEPKETLEEIRAKFSTGRGFDELITRATKLLKTIETRFEYILVDEYQDIDEDQHKLIKLLAKGHNLFVVGDDYQAIYGFRGSKVKFITKFQDYYPESTTVNLTHNYRVPKNIFAMAEKVISQNKKQIHKEIKTIKKDGTIKNLSWLNEWKEAEGIIAEIKTLDCPLEEIAILYRHHKRAEVIKVIAKMHELPHSTDRKVKNGVSFLTCHSAKGLEFDTVFLLDNHKKSFTKKNMDEEEERRVQYVALTRAKERLYLSSTQC